MVYLYNKSKYDLSLLLFVLSYISQGIYKAPVRAYFVQMNLGVTEREDGVTDWELIQMGSNLLSAGIDSNRTSQTPNDF